MAGNRLIVISGASANETAIFLGRVARETIGMEIAGVLCERPPIERSLSRILRDTARDIGHALLRFAQASTLKQAGPRAVTDAELARECHSHGIEIRFTPDLDSAESLEFVRSSRPDWGVALGVRVQSAAALRLPRLGSILSPLTSRETDPPTPRVLVTVCRTPDQPDVLLAVRSRSLQIFPFDTTVSLSLKSALVGEDLLIEVLREFSAGTSAPSGDSKSSAPILYPASRAAIETPSTTQGPYRAARTRAAWKLVLRSSAYLWLLPFRNWTRRLRKRFPLVILCHHLISDRPHPMGLSTERFLKHLRYLKRHYRLVSLHEGLRLLASNSIDQPTAVLTFDDGYEDNFLTLRAVLRVEPAPVTMFVCSELVEKGQPFPHDVRDHREGFAPLSPAEVRSMAAEGTEIGSHTRTHYNCGFADRARLESEIAGSRGDLEALLGHPVAFFAFPWGKPANMSEFAVEIAQANYEHIFSAYGGANFPGAAPAHLVRTSYPLSLWELELALQQILEFHPARKNNAAPTSVEPVRDLSATTGAGSESEIGAAGRTH